MRTCISIYCARRKRRVTAGIANILDIRPLKAAEKQLAESKRQLQLAVEGAELGIWDWDIPSGKVTVNERYASILGYSVEELDYSHDRWMMITHPDDLDLCSVKTEHMLYADGGMCEADIRFRHKEGHWVWVSNRGHVVERDSEGNPLRASGVLLDITSRRKAEEELRTSIEVLQAIRSAYETSMSSTNDLAPLECILASIVSVSGSELGFIGLTHGDNGNPTELKLCAFECAKWNPQLHSNLRQQVEKGLRVDLRDNLFADIVRSGQPAFINERDGIGTTGRFPAGHIPIDTFLGVPIRMGNRVLALLGLANRKGGFSDDLIPLLMPLIDTAGQIMEADRIERERLQAHRQLENIVSAIDDGIWEWNPNEESIVWSARAYEMLGYEANEFPMTIFRWYEMVHPADVDASVRAVGETLETGAPSQIEMRFRCKSGAWLWVNSRVRIVERDSEGRPLLMAGAYTNITDRKRMEWRLRARIAINEYAQDHTLNELMVRVVDEAEALTESKIGFFHFVDEDQEHIWLQAWSTNTTRHMCTAEGSGQHYPVPEAGVWADAIRDRCPTIHNNYHTLPHRRGMPHGHAPVTRQMVTPIIRNDRIVAAIGVGNKESDYNEQDLASLVALGDLAWDTIQIKQSSTLHHEAEAMYRSMFWNNNSVKFLVDPVLETVVEANPAACALYGYTQDEITGMRIFEIECTPVEELRADLSQVIARDPASARSIRRHKTANGEIRDVEVYASPILRGGQTLIYAIIHDITDRMRIEEERRRLSLAIDQVTEAVMITDLHGYVEYVNPAFEAATGETSSRLQGRNSRDFHRFLVNPSELEDLAGRLKAEETWVGEVTIRTYTGKQTTVAAAVSPVRDSDGVVRFYVAVGRDISDEVRLYADLRQAQKLESVGQLAGGVAHDFNNLLQIINGYTQIMLDDDEFNPDVRAMLEEVRRAGVQGAELVSQLLAFSRKSVLKYQSIDLHQLVQSWTKGLGRVIGEHIALNIERDAADSIAMADQGMMEQVIMNLCVNARDAMPKGGTITVRTGSRVLTQAFCNDHPWAQAGSFAYLSVSDTGHGMNRETMDHIFEPFFTTKGLGLGTGLGLSTVHGIVTQHGGFIHVESQEGLGTTFTVFIPSGTTAAPSDDVSGKQAIRYGNETILVAEDEPAIRQFAKKVLEAAGYRVLLAEDGEQAIDVYEANSDTIKLVMLDMVMPKLNGVQVYEHITASKSATPFLFCSGYSEVSLESLIESGMTLRLLQKPYTRDNLLESVRTAIDTFPGISSVDTGPVG